MIHHGHEPPWSGGGRYGAWKKGIELWDGTGFVWTWMPPLHETGMSKVLKDYYLGPMMEQFNNEILLNSLASLWGKPVIE